MRTSGTTLSAACRLSLHQITISPGAGPATNRSGASIPDGNQGRGGMRGADLPRPRAFATIPVRVNRSGNPASAASNARIVREGAGVVHAGAGVAGPILQQGLQCIGRAAA